MKTLKGIKNQITLTVDAELMDDNGEVETVPVEMTIVKINNIDEVNEMFLKFEKKELDELEVLGDMLLDWNIKFDDGEMVPLNKENLAAVWQLAPYRNAIVRGFVQVQKGYNALQSKN